MTDTPKTQDAADWSGLPRDMYVVRAWKPDGLFWCAEVAQVPHALAPEVRYVRAIPLPADDAPTEAKPGERIDYTAVQLQAMGEAYAAAYADAMAERAASDDDLVEKGARALAKLYGLEDFAPFYEDARVVLSAMRGEP